MRDGRAVWLVELALAIALGAVGAARMMALEQALATFVALGAIGAVFALAATPGLLSVGHPVLLGASVGGGAALVVPGLGHLLGPATTLVVLVLLVLGSPYVAPRLADRLRRASAAWSLPETGPDDRLRRRWAASTRQLEAARSPDDRLRAVQLRALLLDELVESGDGRLPDYVWVSLRDRRPAPRTPRSP
jgi:hypothetical protein